MKTRDKAAILYVLAWLSQWFHELFIGIEHSTYIRVDNGQITPIYWSDMIYYLFDEVIMFIYVVIACSLLFKDKQAKVLTSGIFGWYLVEVIEIVLKFFNIIDIRTPKTVVGTWQISTSIFLMLLVYIFGRKS